MKNMKRIFIVFSLIVAMGCAPMTAMAQEAVATEEQTTEGTNQEEQKQDAAQPEATTPTDTSSETSQETAGPVAGWNTIDGKRYYYEEKDGQLVVKKGGKVKIDGKDYYLDKTTGYAKKGWVKSGKYYYYYDKSSYVLKKNTMVDSYKLDKKGRSKTRYLVMQIVEKQTNDKMNNQQKINALYKYVTTNSWTYKRTYEHVMPGWKWYKGWTDDFAKDLMQDKKGNCFRYAAVLGYCVKEATDYQVRVYHGTTRSRSGGQVPHGWITVKQKNGKWYAYDPDMYKFTSHNSIYKKNLFSKTKKTIHKNGKYTKLY